ncbi:MAG: hypothetical protein JSV43_01565 [Methanobacteriota archaeon]|nr:MAG: hypothetical protein JSV43_01565 [Euryarchaeota archaeon]
MPEISFDQPVAGKKIVAAINSACKKLEGIGFVYTPYQIRYKDGAGEEQWYYNNLSLMISNVSMKIQADGTEKMEAETEYSTISFTAPEGEKYDSDLVNEVFEGFRTVFMSEISRPMAEIAPSPKITSSEDKVKLPELSEDDKKRIEEGAIRILALVQGEYGERIAKHIANNGSDSWEVSTITLDTDLPSMIDDPEEYLPSDVPKADLLLAMQEHSSAAQLIVDIARAAQVRGVIAPIDNSEWLPEGMKNQIERELKEMGVESVFPRPFCLLDEIGSPLIDQFAKCFGRPKLEMKWENDKVTEVDVLVDAACGSAKFVAERLIGESIDDAVEKAGLAHHHFPCLAAMKVEKDLEDTLMHVSGLQIKKAVDKILAPERKKKAVYIDPDTF